MYKAKYFTLNELFPAWMVNLFPEDKLWSMLDEGLLMDIDRLREELGTSIYINHGSSQCRGFRDCYKCKDVGADRSMHRFGCAFDLTVKGMKAEDVRQFIIDNRDKFPHITRMEKDVSWVHVDCRPTNSDEIILFKG